MFQIIFEPVLRSTLRRLITAASIVILPISVSTSWVVAVIGHELHQGSFFPMLLSLLLSSTVSAMSGSYLVLYPLERWGIRDRAATSGRWIAIRLLLYVAAGLPLALILLVGMRVGASRYSPLIESSYFVIVLTNIGVIGLVYSLFERMAEEVRRREVQLQLQIAQYRIEIDQVRRAQQVAEITGTTYFQELAVKARQQRNRKV